MDWPEIGDQLVKSRRVAEDDSLMGERNFYDRYIAPYFKTDGQPEPDVVARRCRS